MRERDMDTVETSYASIDELLGDSRERFFGAGYRRVGQEVRDVTIDTSRRIAEATARISYPTAWSTKRSRPLEPHLSTLDALIIGAQLCEAYVRVAFGVEGADADRLWLARTCLKPSNLPTTDLDRVPASCRLVQTRRGPDLVCGHLSSFDVQVGGMKLELAIDHPVVRHDETRATVRELTSLLGPTELRYYGSAYASTDVQLRDISFADAGDRVRARFDLIEPDGARKLQGMGAAYAPFVSPTHTIIGTAQLAQALLYRYDQISRDVSHNLWMRRVVFDHPKPVATDGDLCIQTWTSTLSLLPLRQATWRCGSFGVTMPGVTGTYHLAHQLPSEHELARV